MKRTGVFYGSSTENTEAIAKTIAKRHNGDCFNVATKPANEIQQYSNLIPGTSTWGLGELQDDWDSFLKDLEMADLTGKKFQYPCSYFFLFSALQHSEVFVDYFIQF